jgi:4-amino-4-deoxy-L-arabinose transferase-like glycosyltransferase
MKEKLAQLSDWFATSHRALLALWALYLVPRALLILLDVQPWSDAAYYFERAAELANGQGYLSPQGVPTAFWPPGFSLALAGVFKLLGTSVLAVGLFNLACAAASAALVLALGRKLGGSELAARLALLLLALYPNSAAYVPLALTEVFYTTLLLAICWLVVCKRSWLALVGAGLLLGAATLVKAQTLVVVPLILGIAVLRAPLFWPAVRGAIGKGVLLGLLAALTIAPWTLRNQRVLGETVFVSTNGGVTLLTGNNANANGTYVESDPVYQALFARRLGMSEPAYDAEAKRLGMQWIEANPGQFVLLMPLKFARLWGPDGEAQWNYEMGVKGYPGFAMVFNAVRVLNQLWYFALLSLFVLAAWVQLRRRWRSGQLFDWWLLPYGIAAYPSAIAVVFSGQSRFHYPAMPFIAISAAWLIADWLARRRVVSLPPNR